jgi:hypothetical protein
VNRHGLTPLQVAVQRLRRDITLCQLELTEREWAVLLSIAASFIARESARGLEEEWRRAA